MQITNLQYWIVRLSDPFVFLYFSRKNSRTERVFYGRNLFFHPKINLFNHLWLTSQPKCKQKRNKVIIQLSNKKSSHAVYVYVWSVIETISYLIQPCRVSHMMIVILMISFSHALTHTTAIDSSLMNVESCMSQVEREKR